MSPIPLGDYETNRDFMRSALHAIATTPALGDLYRSLVLKGSVALNVAYGSNRMSRGDMDFGLVHLDHRITRRDFENLLFALDDWAANSKSLEVVVKGDGIDTPLISFVHPRTRRRGELKLQTSAIQVPPVLAAELLGRGMERFATYDGRPFEFRVMRLEEVAAEKMCRLWRPDKFPPRRVDLYDIGFCTERRGFNEWDVIAVVRLHRKTNEKNLIKIADAMPHVRDIVRDPAAGVAEAKRLAFYGPGISDDIISTRIKTGFVFLDRMARGLQAK